MTQYKIVSADAHVNVPAEELKARIPEKFWQDIPMIRASLDADSGKSMMGMIRKSNLDKMTEEDLQRVRAGGCEPELRLKDMERDGVVAEIIYSVISFNSENEEAERQLHTAANDWAIELFGPYKNQLSPSAGIPVADPKWAAKEVEKVAKQGFTHVLLPIIPPNTPYNRDDYVPLWEAISDTGLAANFHIGTGHKPQVENGPGGPVINFLLGAQADGINLVAYLCAGGVLKRFPKLKFNIIEGDASWLPWALGSLDNAYEKHHFWLREQDKLDMKPSEYFKRQGHAHIMDDATAVRLRDEIGVHTLTFGSDYPHHEGTWPNSQKVIQKMFVGVPENEVAQIVGGNAAELYGLQL